MRVVVTGGAGFIGSALAAALVARSDDVLVVDDLSTGRRDQVPEQAAFHQSDISRSAEDLALLFAGREVVFHTAALPRIQRSIDDPLGTHAANVTGTLAVLKAARDAGVRRVVFSSSSSVYGEQEELPLREEMPPRPVSPYAGQKLMGEIYCQVFTRLHRLETVCLRYFNVYGPAQPRSGPYRLVIGAFLDSREVGEPLQIFGDGQQTRDFTYVDDVVRANLLSADSGDVGRGEVINIGSGREISINRLAHMFGGPAVHLPARQGEERFKRADVRRAKHLLGWSPMTDIEQGVRRVLAHQRRT